MNEKEFLRQLKILFQEDNKNLTPDSVLDSVGWDSIIIVSLIGLINEYCGTIVSEKELRSCNQFKDLLFLAKKMVEA
ncbi:MAG: hypothetical protein K2X39_00075 [Silvanigrellaceae bacterium]|nr:hypothetical protein [Silvanigrellaceae bacterium]